MLSRTLASWGRLLGFGGQPTADTEERRTWGRVRCDVETTCAPARHDDPARLAVRVTNVSPGGICLQSTEPFTLGDLLRVTIPQAPDSGVSEVLACVVRSDRRGNAGHEIGCTFAAPLRDDELRCFLAPADQPTVTDQRGWPRYSTPATATYRLVGDESVADSRLAAVLNISCGGIALRVTDLLSVGDLLSVALQRDGRAPISTLASVVRTTVEPGGNRLVGCNFIHELPEPSLAALLG